MAEKENPAISIVPYRNSLRLAWNNFNESAANGLFLFDRAYMEYHQDRFTDHSLLFYQGEKLIAICPINIFDKVAYSHAGLTFGGLLVGRKLKIHSYLNCFSVLLTYLKEFGIRKFIYKPIPAIFHQFSVLEEQYALFLHNAKLVNRSVSSFIDLSAKIYLSKGRKWSLQQSLKHGLEIKECPDYTPFMQLVEGILTQKYAVKPTHTATEINFLAQKFPATIKLLTVYKEGELIGGSIIYISAQVIHLQYIATSEVGKKYHALDLIVHYLIQQYKSTKKYISFGISPGDDEFKLNTGLIQNKESFGARSLMHDVYEITL